MVVEVSEGLRAEGSSSEDFKRNSFKNGFDIELVSKAIRVNVCKSAVLEWN